MADPRTASGGFTLLELLVAVAIVAIAMGALLAGFARYADEAGYIRQRTLATWVAHNRLNELLLNPAWPSTGSQDDEADLAGLHWRTRQEVRSTDDPALRRIDIRVYAPELRDIKAESPAVASLTTFIANTGRQ